MLTSYVGHTCHLYIVVLHKHVVRGRRRVFHYWALVALAYHQKYLYVDADHGDKRNIEVENGSGYFEENVLVIFGLAGVLWYVANPVVEKIGPASDWNNPQERQDPGCAYHE